MQFFKLYRIYVHLRGSQAGGNPLNNGPLLDSGKNLLIGAHTPEKLKIFINYFI